MRILTNTPTRLLVTLVLFAIAFFFPYPKVVAGELEQTLAELLLFGIAYLFIGYDVLWKAAKNLCRGKIFDEQFLMSIATLGAFCLVLFPDAESHMAEGVAIMLFYQFGEWLQDSAVDSALDSVQDLASLSNPIAHVQTDAGVEDIPVEDVPQTSNIIVRVGERIPLDGVLLSESASLDSSALTGEALPLYPKQGELLFSGSIVLDQNIHMQTTVDASMSTANRIIELTNKAKEEKSVAERFITRFARYYTPLVVAAALAMAIIPGLTGLLSWSASIERALMFLVVSCPCAVIISVPLAIYVGMGRMSQQGVLIKGRNYLESLARSRVFVFDKTGTLTTGVFEVVDLHPEEGIDPQSLLELAAPIEAHSNHPLARAIAEACADTTPDTHYEVQEIPGKGLIGVAAGETILVGNLSLMQERGIDVSTCSCDLNNVHVARNGHYLGHIVLADTIKADTVQALKELKSLHAQKTVMLSGDRASYAQYVGEELQLDQVHAELLPEDKLSKLEELLAQKNPRYTLVYVGDGINDAPALARADIGIAMGALGSDAAIEHADIIVMKDKLTQISQSVAIAQKTMRIVWENIIFSLGIKFAVLILASLGLSNLWFAVFADVGVTILACANALRALKAPSIES